jgi:hypothetical protein
MLDKDYITITQATGIATLQGNTLSRSQIHHLCTQGKLDAQKVGTVWLVSRKSIETYTPEETGFALVWKRRKKNSLLAEKELRAAIEAAKAKQVTDFGGVAMELPEEVQQVMGLAEAKATREE